MTTTPMSASDPFDYAAEDHKLIATLMDQILDATEGAKKSRDELFAELTSVFSKHIEVEELFVYPAIQWLDEMSDQIVEAEHEHRLLQAMFHELTESSTLMPEWREKFDTLKEHFDLHAENEEGDIFKKARNLLNDDQKQEIITKIQEFQLSATA